MRKHSQATSEIIHTHEVTRLHELTAMVTPNSCCTTVMTTVPGKPNVVKLTLLLSEKTPLTRSPRREEDTTSPKEYGLVQGRRVMFSLMGTVNPEKVVLNEHCTLRQLLEMMQSPEVARDKVWVLKLFRESHIWDRVTLRAQVGGSSGGDGESEGDGGAVEAGRVEVMSAQMSAQCM